MNVEKSNFKIADGKTNNAPQVNENLVELTELYEDKNAEILEEDEAAERDSEVKNND